MPFVLALALMGSAHGSTDTTVDLSVRAYCPPGPLVCGYIDEDRFEQHLLRQVAAINETFRPAEMSFRFKELIIERESTYSALTRSNADPETPDGALFQELHELAAQTPEQITLFLLPKLKMCWSAVPPVVDPVYPEALHGFYCSPTSKGAVLAQLSARGGLCD